MLLFVLIRLIFVSGDLIRLGILMEPLFVSILSTPDILEPLASSTLPVPILIILTEPLYCELSELKPINMG